MPAEAKQIARMSHAELIASELATIAREVQSESGAEPGSADSARTAVMSGQWPWQPVAALLVPALAFTITMLVS